MSRDEPEARLEREPAIDAPSAAGAAFNADPEQGAAKDEGEALTPITAWSSPDAEIMAGAVRAKANPAEWMFDRIVKLIEDFESKLTRAEEVGAHLVQAPGEGVIQIHDVGYWAPDLVLFYGRNSYGRPVRLIQHYTQVNVLLTALPIQTDQPRRIGFQLREKLEKAALAPLPSEKAAPRSL